MHSNPTQRNFLVVTAGDFSKKLPKNKAKRSLKMDQPSWTIVSLKIFLPLSAITESFSYHQTIFTATRLGGKLTLILITKPLVSYFSQNT